MSGPLDLIRDYGAANILVGERSDPSAAKRAADLFGYIADLVEPDPSKPGAELLARARVIWGRTDEDATEIVVILAVVLGDLARLVRDGGTTADYQREMGNLILSTARLAAAQHLDVDACITAAEEAQRAYVAKQIKEQSCP